MFATAPAQRTLCSSHAHSNCSLAAVRSHEYIRAERSSPQNGKPRAQLFEPTAAVLAALAGRGAAAHAGARACRLLRALLRRLAAQTSIDRAAKAATPPVSTGHLLTVTGAATLGRSETQISAPCNCILGSVTRGRAPSDFRTLRAGRWCSSHLFRARPMPDLLGTQGALSLQVCGIDGMAWRNLLPCSRQQERAETLPLRRGDKLQKPRAGAARGARAAWQRILQAPRAGQD